MFDVSAVVNQIEIERGHDFTTAATHVLRRHHQKWNWRIVGNFQIELRRRERDLTGSIAYVHGGTNDCRQRRTNPAPATVFQIAGDGDGRRSQRDRCAERECYDETFG